MSKLKKAVRLEEWDEKDPYDLFPGLRKIDRPPRRKPIKLGHSVEELIADGEALQNLWMEADIEVIAGVMLVALKGNEE